MSLKPSRPRLVACRSPSGSARIASRSARSERRMISADSSSQSGRSNSSRKRTRSRAADVVARHLRPQVADRLVRHAHVRADHPHERLVRLAAPHEVHDRDPDALLVDLVRAAAVDAAADVGRVAAGGEEGDHAAAVEHRRDDRHVVDLAGRLPRVVGDQHVARLERVRRVGVHEVAHAGGHRVDVAGRAGERTGPSCCALRSNTPQARSCDSRTTVEKAVRISVTCCSLTTESRRFQSTSRRRTSITPPSPRGSSARRRRRCRRGR